MPMPRWKRVSLLCSYSFPQQRHRRARLAQHPVSYSSTASTSSKPSAASPLSSLPFLFLIGGPCAGKGTQSRLLVTEFGGDVKGTADGTSVDPAILSRVTQRYPSNTGGGPRMAVVHISIGALLRRETQQASASTGEGVTHSPSNLSAVISAALLSGKILPGELTVELLGAEVQRVVAAQRRLNPLLTPVFLVDGFPRSLDNVRHFSRRFGPPQSIILLTASDATLRRRREGRATTSGRTDDSGEVMEKRLTTFHEETMKGVVDWWKRQESEEGEEGQGKGEGKRRMWEVDGERSIDAVYEDVRRVFLEWTEALGEAQHR